LASRLSSWGVEKAVSLSLLGVYYDYAEGNEETLENSRRLPFLIPAATVDPRRYYGRQDEPLNLGQFAALRVFPDLQGWPLDYAPFHKLLEEAASQQVPVMVPAMSPGRSTEIVRVAQAVGVVVILNSVSYWTLSEVLVLLARYDGLYIGTDMLDTPDAVELVTDEVGAERLIFGSNYPFTYFSGPLLNVQRSQISKKDRCLILRENALRILGIK